MEITYNYLRTAFQNLKKETSQNPFPILIVLVLLSIPLPYGFGSAAIILLIGSALFSYKKKDFKIEKNLLIPIALFMLMAISLIWTIDSHSSNRALSKGLPLLIIPLSFFFFPSLTKEQKQKTIQFFSYGILGYTLFYLLKAVVRFLLFKTTDVFFYHELVTEDVNAIHVSIYVAIAFFNFLNKKGKTILDKFSLILLLLFIILLSSKNILIVFFGLLLFYFFKHYQKTQKAKFLKIAAIVIVVIAVGFIGKIKNRFLVEYQTLTTENSLNYEIGNNVEKVYNISVKQAWTQEHFQPNDYFGGFPLRVYQIRIFKELLQENPIFFSGFGLNAAQIKIQEKQIQHNLYQEYGEKNFHNEYIQLFAELGIFGLVLLLLMLGINIKNAFKSKDFMHISFAVLMISLFLTESFLSRQRGIVFFTVMFCLFNSKELIITHKKD